MPLYEYKCVKCGHRFERIESISASETKKCPKCKAKAERMLNAPAIQFKGTGWYVTDYAGKNSGSAAKETGDSREMSSAKQAEKAGEKSSEKAGPKESVKGSTKKSAEK